MKRFVWLCFLVWTTAVFAQPPDTLWTRTLGGAGYDEALAVDITPDGGCYVLCQHQPDYVNTVYKLNAGGEVEWNRAYPGIYFRDIQSMDNGGFVSYDWLNVYIMDADGDNVDMIDVPTEHEVCNFQHLDRLPFGFAVSFMAEWEDEFAYWREVGAVVLDANGQEIGISCSTTSNQCEEIPDVGAALRLTDNSLVLAGRPWAGFHSFLMTRCEGAGWSAVTMPMDDPLEVLFCHAAATVDNGVICAISTYYTDPTPLFVYRFDQNGDTLWRRTLVDDYEGGSACILAAAPGFVVGGTHMNASEADSSDLLLLRVTEDGDVDWTANYGGEQSDRLTDIIVDAEGSCILVGASNSFGLNDYDAYIVKTAPLFSAADPLIVPPSSFIVCAYPNPFNPVTTLLFSLPQAQDVRLVVYDLMGREIARLADGRCEAGQHQVTFDGTELATGIYFAQFAAGNRMTTTKLMLLK